MFSFWTPNSRYLLSFQIPAFEFSFQACKTFLADWSSVTWFWKGTGIWIYIQILQFEFWKFGSSATGHYTNASTVIFMQTFTWGTHTCIHTFSDTCSDILCQKGSQHFAIIANTRPKPASTSIFLIQDLIIKPSWASTTVYLWHVLIVICSWLTPYSCQTIIFKDSNFWNITIKGLPHTALPYSHRVSYPWVFGLCASVVCCRKSYLWTKNCTGAISFAVTWSTRPECHTSNTGDSRLSKQKSKPKGRDDSLRLSFDWLV